MASGNPPDYIVSGSTEEGVSVTRHTFIMDDSKQSRESVISHAQPVTTSDSGEKMEAVGKEDEDYAATESGGKLLT